MQRREFLMGLSSGVLLPPRAVAQTASKVWRVGFIFGGLREIVQSRAALPMRLWRACGIRDTPKGRIRSSNGDLPEGRYDVFPKLAQN